MYGQSYRVKEEILMTDLTARTQHVISREIQTVQDQLARNHVKLVYGRAQLIDPHTVTVRGKNGDVKLTAQNFVIATGTKPARPPNIQFRGGQVVDSDGILNLDKIPSSLVVVGAGVIGIEYASIFAALGSKVTVIERRDRMLDFCDEEIIQALQYQLRSLAVTFRFRETVSAVEIHGDDTLTILESGKTIAADAVMYSAGRTGATEGLGLDALGIEAD
jgi:NAD(P) transhydrogenase